MSLPSLALFQVVLEAPLFFHCLHTGLGACWDMLGPLFHSGGNRGLDSYPPSQRLTHSPHHLSPKGGGTVTYRWTPGLRDLP